MSINAATQAKASVMTKKLKSYSNYMKVTNKVIKMQSPEWAAEARYLAAETAESISADLMYISLTEKPETCKIKV